MRPGRTRRSSSRAVIEVLPLRNKGDGARSIEILALFAESASSGYWSRFEFLHLPNHMRPTAVGAFILPSVGWVPGLPPCDPPTCAKALPSMMTFKRAHGCDVRCDTATNSPSELGERCAESAVVVTGDSSPADPFEDSSAACMLLSGCIGNSGASVHPRATAATSIESSSVPTPINGPTLAT